LKRFSPAVEAPYGMPLKMWTPSRYWPRTLPAVVSTTDWLIVLPLSEADIRSVRIDATTVLPVLRALGSAPLHSPRYERSARDG
jgi:hypothetical protein